MFEGKKKTSSTSLTSKCTIPTANWYRIFCNWMPMLKNQITNRCNKVPWNASYHGISLTPKKKQSFPMITWVEHKNLSKFSILPSKKGTASLKPCWGVEDEISPFPPFEKWSLFRVDIVWGCGSALLYFASQQRCLENSGSQESWNHMKSWCILQTLTREGLYRP